MNNDLISREALKRDLIDNYSFYPAIVKNALEKQPTISPDSLRPKGRWEQIGYDDVLDRITCSHCKEYWNILDNDTETFNFCPNCGAKMEV